MDLACAVHPRGHYPAPTGLFLDAHNDALNSGDPAARDERVRSWGSSRQLIDFHSRHARPLPTRGKLQCIPLYQGTRQLWATRPASDSNLQSRREHCMPGRQINDCQLRSYMRSRLNHTPAVAAAKAGFSTATAYRIEAKPNCRRRRGDYAVDGIPIPCPRCGTP